VSYRIARATQRNPASKKPKTQNPNQTNPPQQKTKQNQQQNKEQKQKPNPKQSKNNNNNNQTNKNPHQTQNLLGRWGHGFCYDLDRRTASEGPHQAKQFYLRFTGRDGGKVVGGKRRGEGGFLYM
jgi:outer membrane biosynthesis protein TonB